MLLAQHPKFSAKFIQKHKNIFSTSYTVEDHILKILIKFGLSILCIILLKNAFPIRSGTGKDSTLTTSIQHYTGGSNQYIKARRGWAVWGEGFEREEVKLISFAGHMISYVENPKVSTKSILE